jgi:hypothetical protein
VCVRRINGGQLPRTTLRRHRCSDLDAPKRPLGPTHWCPREASAEGRHDRKQLRSPGSAIYGMLYGMEKTTVYVPPEVKRALGRLASARGTSEAELIREALRKIVAEAPAPRPRLPLIESGKRLLAERLDEALEGFGGT